MNDCKHCWHTTSRSEHAAGTTVNQKCCHCGEVQSHTYPPFPKQVYEYDLSKHGPFAPDITPKW